MDLLKVMQTFPTQEHCIAYLERLRWRNKPYCPHCGSISVGRREEHEIGRIGRYNCHDCHATFKVTCGTIFHGTKIPLQKWFLAICLIGNAKKSLSSHQLARDLDLNQKTAWRIIMCIRAEMAKKGGTLLQGIIEADETYIGGKPRKHGKYKDTEPTKRGRGTKKTPVIGAVQRGGKVVAQVAKRLSGRAILEFIQSAVNLKDSELITDEFKAYKLVGQHMKHAVVKHREGQYVDEDAHTNTIEGFWSLIKRAGYGQHCCR
ncbi:MAG: IS1595 family transposase [Candidatus Poribacteria bacterium]|nr:IS1595 family transposase [Candidatus Poribacteria bacterium]